MNRSFSMIFKQWHRAITASPMARRWSGLLLITSLLGGCAAPGPQQPPDIRVDDAHLGGSIVAFDHGETLLASGGWEGDIRLYSLPGGQVAGGWHAHSDSVNGLMFLRSGQLVSAGYDGFLARWSDKGAKLQKVETPAPITHMVASETLNRVVTGHNDGTVRLWRLADFTLLATHHDHTSAVRAVALDPTTGRIASSSSDGSVVVWRTNHSSRRFVRPPTDAWSLVFDPHGHHLYGGGWFDLFRWKVTDGSLTVMPTAHRGIIKSLDFNGDGTKLASISRQTDDAVYFLNPDTGKVVRRFQQHDLCGAYIRLSDDGHYLATTSDDASVRVWRLQSP